MIEWIESICFISALLTLLFLLCNWIYKIGREEGEQKIKKDAIANGVGEFEITDLNTGKTEFRFKDITK